MENLSVVELKKQCKSLNISLTKSDGSPKLKKDLIKSLSSVNQQSSIVGGKRRSRKTSKRRGSRKTTKKSSKRRGSRRRRSKVSRRRRKGLKKKSSRRRRRSRKQVGAAYIDTPTILQLLEIEQKKEEMAELVKKGQDITQIQIEIDKLQKGLPELIKKGKAYAVMNPTQRSVANVRDGMIADASQKLKEQKDTILQELNSMHLLYTKFKSEYTKFKNSNSDVQNFIISYMSNIDSETDSDYSIFRKSLINIISFIENYELKTIGNHSGLIHKRGDDILNKLNQNIENIFYLKDEAAELKLSPDKSDQLLKKYINEINKAIKAFDIWYIDAKNIVDEYLTSA